MPRKILHLDLDAFFCAVEEQRDPTLRGKAFAVGGTPDQRGVVASCSYPARRRGVRSAMPMSQAMRLCPDLLIVPHHFDAYHAMSAQVMQVLLELTPLVEQISIDEAFLDLTDLPESAEFYARALQKRINGELHLPVSLGVAANKLVAKIANNIGKASVGGDRPPNSIKAIATGEEASFLAPLPTIELWGVGPKTAEALAQLGLHTIGDIAHYPEIELARHFGKMGVELHSRALGEDERPLVTSHETKSISRETTFTPDLRDRDTLKRLLREFSESIAKVLVEEELRGRTVKIKLRWTDFTTITRQIQLPKPTATAEEIYYAALELLDKHYPAGRAVRLLGVGISHFESHSAPDPRQLSLWDEVNPLSTNKPLPDSVNVDHQSTDSKQRKTP